MRLDRVTQCTKSVVLAAKDTDSIGRGRDCGEYPVDDRLGFRHRLKGVPALSGLRVDGAHRVRIDYLDRRRGQRFPSVAGQGFNHDRGWSPHVDASQRQSRLRQSEGRAASILSGEPDPDNGPLSSVHENARALTRVGGFSPGWAGRSTHCAEPDSYSPAVIPALEHVPEIAPDGETDAAMRTAVLPCVDRGRRPRARPRAPGRGARCGRCGAAPLPRSGTRGTSDARGSRPNPSTPRDLGPPPRAQAAAGIAP